MPNVLLLTLEMRPYTGSSLVTTGVQVASNPLGLVSIQVSNISCQQSCRSSRKPQQSSHILKIMRNGERGVCMNI